MVMNDDDDGFYVHIDFYGFQYFYKFFSHKLSKKYVS